MTRITQYVNMVIEKQTIKVERMTIETIIKAWKTQGGHLAVSESEFFDSFKVLIKREEIIQVLESLGHCNNIIEDDKKRLEWYKLNNWNNLVSMMNCALDLKTNSFLNIIN